MQDAILERKQALLCEINRLHERHLSAASMTSNYYEPGKMEYPAQSDGSFDSETGEIMLRFESKGTRYEGRTERIETLSKGTPITLVRDPGNAYNHNNYILMTETQQDVGNMPADLCNAVAPLQDEGLLVWKSACVSYVEPISRRSRYAKQAILFVEAHGQLKEMER